jgi:hypothetical protein
MMILLLVTLTSMLLAAIMSVIAWRIAGDERRRSEMRVAALAADIHDEPPVAAAPVVIDDLDLRPTRGASIGADLFNPPERRAGSRWPAVLAGGAFVLGSAVALVVVMSGGSNVGAHGDVPAQPAAGRAAAPAPPPAAPAHPLELVALGHERDGDRLIVRGVLRNPNTGAPIQGLAAVVFLFNREGGFVTSGRVAIDTPVLRPGAEVPFVVTVPAASDVGRYRVSFRTEDRVVPHVDRRDPLQAKL